jgi:ribosomal RNA-processing protein 36
MHDAPAEPSSSTWLKARANKNRPSELSSRRPVARHRVAPGLLAGISKKKHRDPRFDTSGEAINEAGWRKSYDFVFEKQRAGLEAKEAKKKKKKKKKKRGKAGGNEEHDAEVERIQNWLRMDEQRALKASARKEARKEEMAAVRAGKMPFFHKERSLQQRELAAKYQGLAAAKGTALDQFIGSRRRKLGNKQHTALPRERAE